MKMKSFAMIAVSGLLSASFAFAAPATADDSATAEQSMTTLSDNSMQNQNSSQQNNTNSAFDVSSNTNTTDEGSPDQATGDDDY